MHCTLPVRDGVSAVQAEYSGGPEAIRPHLGGEALPAVLDYWERLRGSRRFPPRSAFDPMALRAHLAQVYLLDVLPDHVFRYRVVGGAIADFFGETSPVGLTPEEVFGATAGIALAPYRLVSAQGCLYMHTASAVWLYRNRPYVHYSVLLLPMGESEQRVDKILAIVDFVPEREAPSG
ncbi:MAG: PAS domain-containing protein [Parvibaculum sp.]